MSQILLDLASYPFLRPNTSKIYLKVNINFRSSTVEWGLPPLIFVTIKWKSGPRRPTAKLGHRPLTEKINCCYDVCKISLFISTWENSDFMFTYIHHNKSYYARSESESAYLYQLGYSSWSSSHKQQLDLKCIPVKK